MGSPRDSAKRPYGSKIRLLVSKSCRLQDLAFSATGFGLETSIRRFVATAGGGRLVQGIGELGDIAAGDPDLLEQGVDQRRLGAVAQRAVDDRIREAAAAALAVAAADRHAAA